MLFKYLPSERVDVLENLKIRFSPLKSLNDPFEAQPLIDLSVERDQQAKVIANKLESLWENTAEHERTEENRAWLEKEKEQLLLNLNEMTNPFNLGQELMTLLSDNLGVLSLSRTCENLLMWSHYAQEGKGFVIGFDDKHDFFNQPDLLGNRTNPIPVIYTNKRSHIVLREKSYYEKLLCEKPRNWAYEEEERVFRTFFDKSASAGFDPLGMSIILTGIPKEVIKCIYLGYNVSNELEGEILSAIAANKISCCILRAKVSTTEYKVEFYS